MSFARGLGQGVNAALNVYNTMQRSEQLQRQNDRQDQQWAREDKQRDMLDKANEAARKAFESHQSAFQAQNQPKPAEERINLTLGGGQAGAPQVATPTLGANEAPTAQFGDAGGASLANSMGVSAQPGAIPTEKVAAPKGPKYDEREGVLAGISARRKFLMSNGADMDAWLGDWGKESQLRGMIRTERIDDAEKRFMATGDPAEYAKSIYPLIDDGMEFVSSKPVKTVDGQQAWEFVRRNSESGKEVSSTMTLPQFQKFMMAVRDPKMVAEYESKSLLERLKADEKIRADREGEVAKQGTERLKSNLQLGEIAAKGKEDRKTVGARGAEDRATNKAKPLVLGAEDMAYGQEDTANGTQLVPIAKGGGKGTRSVTADKLNSMVIENYGVSDLAGKPVGSDATARISAAAEILLRANPSMGANEAITRAARDLNLNVQPKN